MDFSPCLSVRQDFPDRAIKNIPSEVQSQLENAGFAASLPPGASIAIGVGSRGISNYALIVREVADYWKRRGCKPFIFPAMGSHGAATAEGQAAVLARAGISEAEMGCPIRSQLDVVSTGATAEGIDTVVDKIAYQSDGIMLVNRVKRHTDFAGEIESGLFKMMAIGLGKLAGARRYHTHAYNIGLDTVLRSVGRQILRSGKILGGLAILEDEYHNVARLAAVGVQEMEEKEKELLRLAKSWMGRIPVPEVDILIVDEIGKDISGTGMDTKVVNRTVKAEYNTWPDAPRIHRIFLRGISPHSYGSAIGIGMADVITDRLAHAIDWTPTAVNCITASALALPRLPLHYPTDRECIERLAGTVGKLDTREVTFAWIHNTLELSHLVVSESLRDQIEGVADVRIEGRPFPLRFDTAGNLEDPWETSP